MKKTPSGIAFSSVIITGSSSSCSSSHSTSVITTIIIHADDDDEDNSDDDVAILLHLCCCCCCYDDDNVDDGGNDAGSYLQVPPQVSGWRRTAVTGSCMPCTTPLSCALPRSRSSWWAMRCWLRLRGTLQLNR